MKRKPDSSRLGFLRSSREGRTFCADWIAGLPSPPVETVENPEAAVALAERSLGRGEPLLAFNAAQVGLERWPAHPRLRQLQALSLARSGDVERANHILAALAAQGMADTETLAMLARTHKDLGLRAADPTRRNFHLAASFDLYRRGFDAARERREHAGAYYAGINAATVAVLMGDLSTGQSIAHDVIASCEGVDAAAQDAVARYWREATLGEAALILGQSDAAATHYARAVALADGRFGDLGSTRRQARLLAAHLPQGDAALSVLRIPPVLVFTGNMIDAPGREAPRFPPELEEKVRDELRVRLAQLSPMAAYGSAACGADILFLEAMRERGGETHVVLPFPPQVFRRESVDFAGGDWGVRFDRALAAAGSVTIASEHRASGSTATFEYANLILTGLGRLRAERLDTEMIGIAAWDPGMPGARGGAAALATLWEQHGVAVNHVDLASLWTTPSAPPLRATASPEEVQTVTPVNHEIRSMLFADAVGYSQLSEDQVPLYVTGFLGAVAGLNARTVFRFEHVETAGDGLYMVFANAGDAGHYALELSELMQGFDRAACGLPPGFDLRIALHCGPVHCGRDPITGLPHFTGPHTSRAARIEPITPPGQVYASSAFAAVAAASAVTGLAMNYVGRIPLAKGHGLLELYCVHRA